MATSSTFVYTYNPQDQLWYEVTANIDPENNVTLSVSQSGVPTPPEWIPDAGQPLISVEYYMVTFGLDTLDFSTWTLAALAISDATERYCNHYFRTLSEVVPDGLQLIIANAIREQLLQNEGKLSALKKSESIRNYSYTLSDQYKPGSVLTAYYGSLDLYRVRSFGYFALSAEE